SPSPPASAAVSAATPPPPPGAASLDPAPAPLAGGASGAAPVTGVTNGATPSPLAPPRGDSGTGWSSSPSLPLGRLGAGPRRATRSSSVVKPGPFSRKMLASGGGSLTPSAGTGMPKDVSKKGVSSASSAA